MSKDKGISLYGSYGIDVSKEIEKLLTEELTRSIDKSILRSLGIKSRKEKLETILNKLDFLYNCRNTTQL